MAELGIVAGLIGLGSIERFPPRLIGAPNHMAMFRSVMKSRGVVVAKSTTTITKELLEPS